MPRTIAKTGGLTPATWLFVILGLPVWVIETRLGVASAGYGDLRERAVDASPEASRSAASISLGRTREYHRWIVKRSHDSDAVWTERLLLILVTAVTLAAVDQWVKFALATPAWALHHRSATWFFGSCFLLVAALPLARVPSKGVAVAAGIFCGGVLGNLLSASSNALYVPNPILIGNMTGGVAFNVADTFIVSGNLMLMLTLITVTLRYRDRFARHTLERAIWRRVRELPSRW